MGINCMVKNLSIVRNAPPSGNQLLLINKVDWFFDVEPKENSLKKKKRRTGRFQLGWRKQNLHHLYDHAMTARKSCPKEDEGTIE